MNDATASILGPLIGAIAGLAGGIFAALASIRASQIASRSALAETLFRLGKAQVRLGATLRNTEGNVADVDKALSGVQSAWNRLATQQRILCPSRRMEGLLAIAREASGVRSADAAVHMLLLSGQVQVRIATIVGVYSQKFFRFSAKRQEKKIIRDWLASKESEILTGEERAKIKTLC